MGNPSCNIPSILKLPILRRAYTSTPRSLPCKPQDQMRNEKLLRFMYLPRHAWVCCLLFLTFQCSEKLTTMRGYCKAMRRSVEEDNEPSSWLRYKTQHLFKEILQSPGVTWCFPFSICTFHFGLFLVLKIKRTALSSLSRYCTGELYSQTIVSILILFMLFILADLTNACPLLNAQINLKPLSP